MTISRRSSALLSSGNGGSIREGAENGDGAIVIRLEQTDGILDRVHFSLLGLEKRVADLRGRGVYAGFPDRHRCIFVHIPKTAGMAIVESLFPGERSRHDPYYVYRQANARKFRSYFKFAFVRNPWDRLVSSYAFLRDGGNDAEDKEWSRRHLASYPDFKRFIMGWLTPENARSWIHFIPQSDFILDLNGHLMVDYVGRYENLVNDVRVVAERLGRAAPLLKTNQSNHALFSTYFDPETAEVVRSVYGRDMKAFDYPTDPAA